MIKLYMSKSLKLNYVPAPGNGMIANTESDSRLKDVKLSSKVVSGSLYKYI